MKGPRKTVPENAEKLEQEETKGQEEPILDTLAFVPDHPQTSLGHRMAASPMERLLGGVKPSQGATHFKTRDSRVLLLVGRRPQARKGLSVEKKGP